MANWLQKWTASLAVPAKPAAPKTNLPVATNPKQTAIAKALEARVEPAPVLPGASIIYGMAASGLFVIALYFLFTGRWFTGFLVLLPAACFLGFALHFLKIR